MLILNLKTYEESLESSLEKMMNEIKEFADRDLYIAPEVTELANLRENFPDFKIISQHVDAAENGQSTGWIPPEVLLDDGVNISIYNHSEHRVWNEKIIENIQFIQSKGVKLIVCCQNLEEAKKLIEAKPMAIAYEPPELIGSGISVTTKPEVVKEFIGLIPEGIIPVIGAGVSTGDDVRSAVQLGAKGVLVASAFIKAQNHKEKLQELLDGFGYNN